ncbi:MAG: hypothetical protein WC845_03915 [Candidatus Staskawiczbacteria bacterium]|jgi:hypothetical protein
MEPIQEAKNLIAQSENIYVLPSQESEESIINTLALFYTLKELNKNVNLIIDEIPERLKFLIPSLSHISYPRNFVISVPNDLSKISQVRYEKDENNLKINLTIDKGNIKKNDVSFYFADPKADLLITTGLKEFDPSNHSNFLEKGTLIDIPILNIDNHEGNKNFGKVNLLNQKQSLSGLVFSLIESINENLFKKDVVTALLSGLILYSDNFQNKNTQADTLGAAAFLIEKGASREEIVENLYNRNRGE